MKSKCAAARENERAHRPAEAKPRFLQRSPLPPADLQGDSGLRQGAVGTTRDKPDGARPGYSAPSGSPPLAAAEKPPRTAAGSAGQTGPAGPADAARDRK